MNTKKFGSLRMFVYSSGNQYVGVCLDLNVIVCDASLEAAIEHIVNASKGHVETIVKENLSDQFLNERAEFKYYLIYYVGKLFGWISKVKRVFQDYKLPVANGVLVGNGV